MRRIVPLALTMASVLTPPSARAETRITLQSVQTELPDDTKMYSGPGSEVMNNVCLACHSADMVLNQPPMSPQAWLAVVHKMVRIYNAPVDEEDAAAVLDYLTRVKGAY